MSLLSEARTITNTVAEHVDDHTQIAKKLNGAINPKSDYAAAGDGTTNDRAALASAFSAATSLPVVLPPGTFLSTFDATNKTLTNSGSIEIKGADRDLTVLQAGPSPITTTLTKLLNLSGAYPTVRDIDLRGPATGAADWTEAQNIQSYAIYYANTGTSGYLTVRDVRISQEFLTAIHVPSGSTPTGEFTLDIRDSDIQARSECIEMYANNTATKRLHIFNSYIHDAGFTDPHGHLVYCHPSVDIHIEGCRFNNNYYYAIQNYGQSPTRVPGYCRFVDCLFDTGCTFGILTSNLNPRSIVRGCTFKTSNLGLHLQNGALIEGCDFLTDAVGAGGIAVYSGGTTGMVVDVQGCRFYLRLAAIDMSGSTDAILNVSDCLFQMYRGVGVNPGGTGSGQQINIKDSHFVGRTGNDQPGVYATRGISRISGCVFEGEYVGTAAISANNASLTDAQIDNCEFNVTSGDAIKVTSAATGKVYGRNNFFRSGYPKADASTVAYFQLRQGVGSALTSAATISPTFNFDTYHVTGTTTIDNILMHNDAAAQRACAGKVYLIFDSTAATSTAGNIKPKSTAARTANEMACFQYDPATTYWYEVA